MNEKINCLNCGAPLHYNDNDTICKCKYCDTEYHLKKDVSGVKQIEEYEIELEIMGEKHKFYIGDFKLNHICKDNYRDINGNMIYQKIKPKITMNLIEM
jgi:ribosomal protein L31